jgi:hypothetical protein
MYTSGKIQLTIEKFKRIFGYQMSLAAFLAWTPFDALNQCLSCLSCTIYHLARNKVTDILKNKVDSAYLHVDLNIYYND